jgi:hypothetical protein
MRYVAMQVLTWGTIAGAIGSALLLAALENPVAHLPVGLPLDSPLPTEPTQAGRPRPAATTAAPAVAAASAAR